MKETYFEGTDIEWCSVISEESLDKVIEILGIDPNKMIIHPKDSNIKKTLRDTIWFELANIIHVYGRLSLTELEISQIYLKRHVEKIDKTILNTLELLEGQQYEALFEKGTNTKEFIVAKAIRKQSKIIEGKTYRNVSDLLIKQEHSESGEWGEHSPFDAELPQAIQYLQKISLYVNGAVQNLSKDIQIRGKKKPSKDSHDNLIFQLCTLYKNYTGKIPMSWPTGTSSFNSGHFTGDIIPFLQTTLSQSNYKGKDTPGALQKKIYRMKDKEKYKDLWQDTKK